MTTEAERPVPGEVIQTERLELIPFTAEFLRASLDGRCAAAAELLGATLPANWPDHPDTYRLFLGQLEADPSLRRWLVRGMVLRSENRLVGHLGFHTSPGPEYLSALAPGGIEFGYTVFEADRRRHFATEAVEALMGWARTRHGITRFVVSISPANTPSLGLAAKFGFQRIGSHMDEVDGLEEIFERVVG